MSGMQEPRGHESIPDSDDGVGATASDEPTTFEPEEDLNAPADNSGSATDVEDDDEPGFSGHG
jgi:hypothetical protein